ncbi:unnamed protein product, partial [Ilex paraguariensis]
MEYVYDYMFHLLNEYAKLLKYKPTVPPGAVEVCSETMVCNAKGLDREFMIESMGILQLLRLYPRKLPDLGLFFGCGNRTVIGKRDYMGVHPRKAPPMFRYCGDDSSLDLVSLIGLSGD